MISDLQRSGSPLIRSDTAPFLRDVYDHSIHVMDSIELLRDLLASLLDLYMSHSGFRMNEIMKVLTMIATVFIPLTFIAGVYGMNFRVMPELGWRWSYPVLWVIMIAISSGMLVYFKKKKWW